MSMGASVRDSVGGSITATGTNAGAVFGCAADSGSRLAISFFQKKNVVSRSVFSRLYKDVVENDTDPDRIKIAEKRLTELTGGKK